MKEIIFLFILGLVWTVFAVVVDLKKREVPNWLNFSLIGFGLSYRAFYSLGSGDGMFFLSGLAGFFLAFALAHLFYYGRIFAGGDAKLLMGFGVILPYGNFWDLIYYGGIFVIALFSLGAIYSLIYSVFIVLRNKNKFRKEFNRRLRNEKLLFGLLAIAGLVFLFFDFILGVVMFVSFMFIGVLYFYVKALDKCMVVEIKAMNLQEGDWLERDVKIGRKIIKKSVHGLSLKEIAMLKKANKKVLVREGIPFTPAFLAALIFMVFFLIV